MGPAGEGDGRARRLSGLSAAEAAARLATEGPNALANPARAGWLVLLAQVLREPMFLLLVGASAVYLALGDLREALALVASIALVVAITVVQERRTERALEALRDLSSPRALVVRDGREQRIAGRDVVRGAPRCCGWSRSSACARFDFHQSGLGARLP